MAAAGRRRGGSPERSAVDETRRNSAPFEPIVPGMAVLSSGMAATQHAERVETALAQSWPGTVARVMPGRRVYSDLDPQSRLRVRVFAFKLLTVIPISVMIAGGQPLPLLQVFAFFCAWHAVFSGIAALLLRQSYCAPALTAWDEMAAFCGLALLARLAA